MYFLLLTIRSLPRLLFFDRFWVIILFVAVYSVIWISFRNSVKTICLCMYNRIKE